MIAYMLGLCLSILLMARLVDLIPARFFLPRRRRPMLREPVPMPPRLAEWLDYIERLQQAVRRHEDRVRQLIVLEQRAEELLAWHSGRIAELPSSARPRLVLRDGIPDMDVGCPAPRSCFALVSSSDMAHSAEHERADSPPPP